MIALKSILGLFKRTQWESFSVFSLLTFTTKIKADLRKIRYKTGEEMQNGSDAERMVFMSVHCLNCNLQCSILASRLT